MAERDEEQILIVTGIGETRKEHRAERGFSDSLVKGAVNSVSVAILKENMASFFGQLREILDNGADRIGVFDVEEVEVSAQITGDGKVCMMGSGVQVGVQGGIKFLLKRLKNK